MSYREFKIKVRKIANRAGEEIEVKFHHNKETGKYYANFTDAACTTIEGNSKSLKVTVKWGNRHQAMAAI